MERFLSYKVESSLNLDTFDVPGPNSAHDIQSLGHRNKSTGLLNDGWCVEDDLKASVGG